ncbi:unnamed protein product, partial [Musa acuminata subsp. malaccensis]
MIKEEVFSPSADMCSFLPPSAYETAWVAMIPCPHRPSRPMFPKCLNWILRNQREDGFWGECRHAMDSLTATIACLVALKTWKVGNANVEQGLRFLNENMEKLLTEHHDRLTWGVHCTRREQSSGVQGYHPPSLFFLEALPASYRPKHELILHHQMEDGSLFHSPSATACAFMITGDAGFREYLHGVIRRFGNFVPAMFPVDQDLIKLCLVDHLRQLGCGEHFANETHDLMDQIYRAAHFMFPREVELHNAKLFSEKILQKSLCGSDTRNNPAIMTDLQKQ